MKAKASLVGAVLVGFLTLALTACTLTDATLQLIAKNAGLFSAVGWIAIDNPSADVVKAVTNVLSVVKDKASSVEAGKTYVEVVYPEVVKVIDVKVESQYRPLCKVGAITILGQLDLLFATYPEWKSDQTKALSVTVSFVDGVQVGLSTSETSAMMKQVRLNAKNRQSAIAAMNVVK